MKKNDIFEGVVNKTIFPNKGIISIDNNKVSIKKTIKGQKVRFRITKTKNKKYEGKIIEIIKPSSIEDREAPCIHFGDCGGCFYQRIQYFNQLNIKKEQVISLLNELNTTYTFEGIEGSPTEFGYRNKMEYSFGDSFKGGPLSLGMHKKERFYDIITTDNCLIVQEDYNKLLKSILDYFMKRDIPYYRKNVHKGYLRHLVIRKSVKTGGILLNLVTTTQLEVNMDELVKELLDLKLKGNIVGILHTFNDSVADIVQSDHTDILYGQDYFFEELLGLRFKISAFSFFQTNSLGAEILYNVIREYIGDTKDKVLFDLYSGTGTIGQILAPVARKVIGVEIVEEAVNAANDNAKLNNLGNCKFIAGDVLKVIDSIEEKPDIIVLDPPREGIHPKALRKIIDFDVEQIIYVSCKPTSLVKDLQVFLEHGYKVEEVRCVDMFPQTVHVETVVRLQRQNP